MKFTLKDAEKFGWKDLKGWAYNSRGDFESASAAYIEMKGVRGIEKNRKSDIIYYVVAGNTEFVVGKNRFKVDEKDVVFVPRDTFYSYKSFEGVKLFEVNVPALDLKHVIRLEEK